MTWKLTEWTLSRDYFKPIEEFLSGKSKDWIPEGSSFILPGMGMGHLYLEREHIYYNPTHQKSFCDSAVAEWKE